MPAGTYAAPARPTRRPGSRASGSEDRVQVTERTNGKAGDARRIAETLLGDDERCVSVHREDDERVGDVGDAVERPELGEVADVGPAPAVSERDQPDELGGPRRLAHAVGPGPVLRGTDPFGLARHARPDQRRAGTTTSRGRPARKCSTFSTARRRPASITSRVLPPLCGVSTTFVSPRIGVPGGEGLLVEDVQRRAGEAAVTERVHQRGLVDQRAARGVHQERRGLHEGEALASQVALGVGAQPKMEAHDVGLPEERLDGDVARAGRGRAPRVGPVGGGQEPDAERPQELRDPAADRAEPDEAHGAPFQLDELSPGPLASPRVTVHRRDAAGDGQHEPDGVLGDRVGVHSRRVRDRHPARPAGRQVDVVGARAPDRDEAQLGARGQDRIGEARMGTDVDHDLRVADPSDQLRFLIRPALGVHGDAAEPAQPRLGGRAGEGGREVVGDHDLEAHRASSLR